MHAMKTVRKEPKWKGHLVNALVAVAALAFSCPCLVLRPRLDEEAKRGSICTARPLEGGGSQPGALSRMAWFKRTPPPSTFRLMSVRTSL